MLDNLKNWLNRVSSDRRRPASLRIERLEDRTVLTANLYLDFGTAFPAGGLQIANSQLRASPINGPSFVDSQNGVTDSSVLTFTRLANYVTFDFNLDGSINSADAADLQSRVVDLVSQYLYSARERMAE